MPKRSHTVQWVCRQRAFIMRQCRGQARRRGQCRDACQNYRSFVSQGRAKLREVSLFVRQLVPHVRVGFNRAQGFVAACTLPAFGWQRLLENLQILPLYGNGPEPHRGIHLLRRVRDESRPPLDGWVAFGAGVVDVLAAERRGIGARRAHRHVVLGVALRPALADGAVGTHAAREQKQRDGERQYDARVGAKVDHLVAEGSLCRRVSQRRRGADGQDTPGR